MIVIYLIFLFYGSLQASAPQSEPEPRVPLLYVAQYDECEGKDANNYTLLWQLTESVNADNLQDQGSQLVQGGHHENRAVNSLKVLARSVYNAGAKHQLETVWLITGGPLQGKYLYEKSIYLRPSYLKHFSSVLGYSYVGSVSASLLIGDKLGLEVFISPNGGYEVFKRGCTTQCKGRAYFVA